MSHPERLTPGAIWQETLAALRPDFWTLFAVAAPFTLLVSMAVTLFGPPAPEKIGDLTLQTLLLLGLLPNVIGAIAQLTVVHMVLRPGAAPRAALSAGLAALPKWLGALLLMALPLVLVLALLGLAKTVVIGFLVALSDEPQILLPLSIGAVVLGLYLTVRLLLIAPVLVVEPVGSLAAITRSWRMTASRAWPLVWLFALLFLGFSFLSLVAGGLGAAIASVLTFMGMKSVGAFVTALFPAVLSTVIAIVTSVVAAVVYRRLAG